MRKTLNMNKHQKAAHRPGEVKVSRDQVVSLIAQSCSSEAEERLEAAKYLCPCHVQGFVSEAWDALYRMMADEDARVRYQAWHALEDGGLPSDPTIFARLEQLYNQERDPKVRRFAWMIIGNSVQERERIEMTRRTLSARPAPKTRGKCDFCGERDVPVARDLETLIPTSGLPRAAWICERCTQG